MFILALDPICGKGTHHGSRNPSSEPGLFLLRFKPDIRRVKTAGQHWSALCQ